MLTVGLSMRLSKRLPTNLQSLHVFAVITAVALDVVVAALLLSLVRTSRKHARRCSGAPSGPLAVSVPSVSLRVSLMAIKAARGTSVHRHT